MWSRGKGSSFTEIGGWSIAKRKKNTMFTNIYK